MDPNVPFLIVFRFCRGEFLLEIVRIAVKHIRHVRSFVKMVIAAVTSESTPDSDGSADAAEPAESAALTGWGKGPAVYCRNSLQTSSPPSA